MLKERDGGSMTKSNAIVARSFATLYLQNENFSSCHNTPLALLRIRHSFQDVIAWEDAQFAGFTQVGSSFFLVAKLHVY